MPRGPVELVQKIYDFHHIKLNCFGEFPIFPVILDGFHFLPPNLTLMDAVITRHNTANGDGKVN